MTDFFFYGTLCHAPLLRTVLGRDIAVEPAELADHAVYWAAGQSFPMLQAEPGAVAPGILARGLTDADTARLDFYEGGFGYVTRDLIVRTSGGEASARTYLPQTQHWQPGAPWSLPEWAARWGEIVVATAEDVMHLRGQVPAAQVMARYFPMLVRGASRVRAAAAAPTTRRRHADPRDVRIANHRQVYAHFFAVEEFDLSYRRFDGNLGATVNRAAFISGDAVTVLPYDPVRDRVLLVEQFRVGPLARGDAQPWQLEAIAGRIDPGETPEDTARREAVEEAGLALGDLLHVADYYPSPGAKSEYLYSYVALCDLPDEAAGVFGSAAEHEDIRGHLVGFDDLMTMVASGEVANAPLVLTAFWLARERDRLRAGAA